MSATGNTNTFKTSFSLEEFSEVNWMAPDRNRPGASWTPATMAEQKRGIDYHLALPNGARTVECKTEGLPVNFFIELYQLVEGARSLELGYAYKCEADYLLLTNLPGLFGVVVPRAEFLAHAIDYALKQSHRKLSLVVNAKRDVVERAAIGIALPYVEVVKEFKGRWGLIDFRNETTCAAAAQFLDTSNHYMGAIESQKKREALMAQGLETYNALRALTHRTAGRKFPRNAVNDIDTPAFEASKPAVTQGRPETLAWTLRGLVTKQAKFADRFTHAYTTTFPEAPAADVMLQVQATQAARPAAA